MTTIKRITDLTKYVSVLPYASEIFGVYQPLLGWKSKRIQERFNQGFQNDRPLLLKKLIREFSAIVDIKYLENSEINIQVRPGVLEGGKFHSFDSVVLEKIASVLPPYKEYDQSIWPRVITPEYLDTVMKKDVADAYSHAYAEMRTANNTIFNTTSRMQATNGANTKYAAIAAFEHQLQYESSVAGTLLFLKEEKSYDSLKEIFYISRNNIERARNLIRMFVAKDSSDAYLDINNLNPTDYEQLKNVALSPISAVHLFRGRIKSKNLANLGV